MLILLHNYHIKPQQALRRAGYVKREKENDWICPDGNRGRFHAKILDWKTIDLHYDLFVENKHWSPYTPITHGRERGRIYSYIKSRKYREMKDRERAHLMSKYGV